MTLAIRGFSVSSSAGTRSRARLTTRLIQLATVQPATSKDDGADDVDAVIDADGDHVFDQFAGLVIHECRSWGRA